MLLAKRLLTFDCRAVECCRKFYKVRGVSWLARSAFYAHSRLCVVWCGVVWCGVVVVVAGERGGDPRPQQLEVSVVSQDLLLRGVQTKETEGLRYPSGSALMDGLCLTMTLTLTLVDAVRLGVCAGGHSRSGSGGSGSGSGGRSSSGGSKKIDYSLLPQVPAIGPPPLYIPQQRYDPSLPIPPLKPDDLVPLAVV